MIRTTTPKHIVSTSLNLITKGTVVMVIPRLGNGDLAEGRELEALIHRGVVRDLLKAEKASS